LLFTHHDDFADVVGIVGADVRDGGCPFGELRVSRRLDGLLKVRHHLIELVNGLVPRLRVEVVEGLVVVAVEFCRRVAAEILKRPLVPEDQVIGELADGVVALAVRPSRLFRRDVGDGDVAADEPVALVMRAVKLGAQDGATARTMDFMRFLGTEFELQ
jgi:hypothetical protein